VADIEKSNEKMLELFINQLINEIKFPVPVTEQEL